MMTQAEARQRANHYNASIVRKPCGEYRVTLREWPIWAKSTEDKAYYTDDLEDAVHTAASMRRLQNGVNFTHSHLTSG